MTQRFLLVLATLLVAMLALAPRLGGRSVAEPIVGYAIVALVTSLVMLLFLRTRGRDGAPEVDPVTGALGAGAIDRRLSPALADPATRGIAVFRMHAEGWQEACHLHGQTTGNALLREIADRATRRVRASQDAVLHLGDGEFLVVLTGLRDTLTDGFGIAWRLRADIEHPLVVGGVELSPAVTMGIAYCSTNCALSKLMNDADIALHHAQKLGPGRIETHWSETEGLSRAGVAPEQQIQLPLIEGENNDDGSRRHRDSSGGSAVAPARELGAGEQRGYRHETDG